MKKQRYIVEIEMPDGDFISVGWLKALIQTDCDVEDESRKKVTVQETSLPSNLDDAAKEYTKSLSTDWIKAIAVENFKAGAEWREQQIPKLPDNLDKAAEEYKNNHLTRAYWLEGEFVEETTPLDNAFKAGAKWIAGQGETVEGVFRAGDPGYPDIRMGEQYSIEHILRKPGGIEPGDEVVVQIRKKEE